MRLQRASVVPLFRANSKFGNNSRPVLIPGTPRFLPAGKRIFDISPLYLAHLCNNFPLRISSPEDLNIYMADTSSKRKTVPFLRLHPLVSNLCDFTVGLFALLFLSFPLLRFFRRLFS